MTNEEAKQEAIKKAWRDYDYFKKDIDENGVYHFTDRNLVVSKLEYIKESDRYRPYSLAGIEHNNGWIRIEPDGSNLPEYEKDHAGRNASRRFKFLNNDSDFEIDMYYPFDGIQPNDILSNYTHYKPITPELNPIY